MDNFVRGLFGGMILSTILVLMVLVAAGPSPTYDENLRQQLFYDCVSKQAVLKAEPREASEYCLTFSRIGSKIEAKE
jgi:hypothetical protein